MKTQNLIAVFAILSANSVSDASIKVNANLGGQINVAIAQTTKYDHNAKCYPLGKGDDHQALPAQSAALANGSQVVEGSGSVSWISAISSPASRLVRNLILSIDSQNLTDGKSHSINLRDHYGPVSDQTRRGDCSHTNTFTNPSSASVEGEIEIQFKVPNDVWFVKVSLTENTGVFNGKNLGVFKGNINEKLEIRKEGYIWAKPGSIVSQKVSIPKTDFGKKDIGNYLITFKYGDSKLFKDDVDLFKVFDQAAS
jgi:hypothetical protein